MDNTYERITEHDYGLFGNVIHQARGNTALDKFANKCGYTNRVFQGYVRQEMTVNRTEASLRKLIGSIVENADPESGITEEKAFAAMGYTPKRYVTAAYKHHLKQVYRQESNNSGGYDYQVLYDSIEKEMTEQEKKDEKFVEYLDDVSFFSATLSDDYIYSVKKRLYKIYSEKTLVKLLHEFHVLTVTSYSETLSSLVRYLKDDRVQDVPQIDPKVIRLHTVLKDLLFDY